MVETRVQFHEELARLEEQALGGLRLVMSQLDRVMEAFSERDLELAAMVVEDDDRIDGRYLEVHQGVLSLLALQAPVAGDLRVIAALIHLIKHVERMGDQCVNVAKLLPLSGVDSPRSPEIVSLIENMGRQARSQVIQAGQAFGQRDLALAQNLVREDEEINRLNRDVFRIATEIGGDHELREWAMHMMLVARCLERIGDNCVDIGEQTAFIVTGLFREFTDASHPGPAPG